VSEGQLNPYYLLQNSDGGEKAWIEWDERILRGDKSQQLAREARREHWIPAELHSTGASNPPAAASRDKILGEWGTASAWSLKERPRWGQRQCQVHAWQWRENEHGFMIALHPVLVRYSAAGHWDESTSDVCGEFSHLTSSRLGANCCCFVIPNRHTVAFLRTCPKVPGLGDPAPPISGLHRNFFSSPSCRDEHLLPTQPPIQISTVSTGSTPASCTSMKPIFATSQGWPQE